MKPYDPKGDYTPEEVKAALAGVDGTRQLSYRYERLDSRNKPLEDLDFIQGCTIENNALADIKRTAKFDILDTGSINYLKDRIKPYVRLTMPEEKSYKDAIGALRPAIWWTLDDAATGKDPYLVNFGTGTGWSTAQSAYGLYQNAGTNGGVGTIQTGSATNRAELWFYAFTSPAQALEIIGSASGKSVGFDYEIYYSRDNTADNLTLFKKFSVAANGYIRTPVTFPYNGAFYVRMIATSTTAVDPYVALVQSTRIEDTSGHKVYGIGGSISQDNRTDGIVNATGGAFYSSSQTDWLYWKTVDEMSPFKLNNGLTTNFWTKAVLTSGQTSYVGTVFNFDDGSSVTTRFVHAFGSTGNLEVSFSGTTTTTVRLYVPDALIGSTAHMVSMSIDPATGTVTAYFDGTSRGSIPVDIATGVFDRFARSVVKVEGYVNYDGASTVMGKTYVDDIVIIPQPVVTSSLTEAFTLGKTITGRERPGYVEWPQGVFLLSSPTRKMIDGNTVVREVEGYDQLVALKEDSFDYRFSIGQGVTYVQGVKTVLQSSEPLRSVKLTDKSISMAATIGAKITSENSATFVPYNYGTILSASDYSMGRLSLSGAFTMTTDPTLWVAFGVRSFQPNNTFASYTIELSGGNTLRAMSDTGVWGSTTYNPTTHKYWQVREAAGVIWFETSADGKVWSVLGSTSNTVPGGMGVQLYLNIQSQTNNGSTLTLSDFKWSTPDNVYPDIESSTKTLPSTMEWEIGTSKLDIINDLLAAINYTSAVYNEDGIFTAKSYISPQNRSAQFRYATDSTSVMVGDIDQTVDLFGVPNKWVLSVSEPDRPPLTGTYTNSDPMSPTSTVSRGRVITDFRAEQDAPDQLTLDAKAARLAFEASQVYEVIEFNTALMPIHQDSDCYELIIDGLAVNNKYSEHSWSMDLTNGSTMKHRARRVISV